MRCACLLAAVGGMLAVPTFASAGSSFARSLQAVPNARIFSYQGLIPTPNAAKSDTVLRGEAVLVSDQGTLPSSGEISRIGFPPSPPVIGGMKVSQISWGSLTFSGAPAFLVPGCGRLADFQIGGWPRFAADPNPPQPTFCAITVCGPGTLGVLLWSHRGQAAKPG